MKRLTVVIGGVQGEGVAGAGAILSKAASRSGYYAFVHRTFASRIKGGHTRSKIEIGPDRIESSSPEVNLVIAFDIKTAEMDFIHSENGCLRIVDKKVEYKREDGGLEKTIALPLSETAETAGNKIAKTTVALGMICSILNLEKTAFEEIIREKYSPKGDSVRDYNISAFRAGLAMGKNSRLTDNESLELDPTPKVARPFMTGNHALALGALSGGCRFVAAYPITPASEIMEYMSEKLPEIGGCMVQTEDEIAAVTMAIGASYGGVRSMTSTSGPGLSLMEEGLGLSGMAEIPLVVMDVQRAGPSTGLPTKVEQSDIDAAFYGGHGEYPSIVLTPYSVETCFSLAREAFALAEEYSCPVLVLSDLALGLFPRTVDVSSWDLEPFKKTEPPAFEKGGESFERYLSGNEIRPVPGDKGGLHYVTGLEHGPIGAPDNRPINRIEMMRKRLNKTSGLSDIPGIHVGGGQGRLLILCTGSVFGVAENALAKIGNGAVLGAVHRIKPFPAKQLSDLSERFDSILIVEYNYSGQMYHLAKKNIPAANRSRLHSLRKFSGEIFTPNEIANKAKELM